MRPTETLVGFQSPALTPPGGPGPAYELKFLLDDHRAEQVEAWARTRLLLDPHGDPALGGAYRTTSLYCDTPELDVYHRSDSYRRCKFRVRRYGSAPSVFLERKAKWGDRVEKRRTAVADDQLQLLSNAPSPATWPGEWFQRRLQLRRLQPACRIAYLRSAYVGVCPESPLRVTLDRQVRGTRTDDWNPIPFDDGRILLTGQVIVEFKFHAAMPAPFKEIVKQLRLSPSIVSKYRLCQEAWGVPALRRESANV